MDKSRPGANPTKEIFLKGSIIGAIITIPSLAAFFIGWTLFEDKMIGLVIGIVIHFIGMGFSFKIAKKLFKVKTSSDSQT